MRYLVLLMCVLFTLPTFSQEVTIHSIAKPLPANITQEYLANSAQRHQLTFSKHKRKSVKIYVNNKYATTEDIATLIGYCEQLLQFTTPNKGMVIKMGNDNMIGRINERVDVISIRITKDGDVYPMVMSVDRLNAILSGLKTL